MSARIFPKERERQMTAIAEEALRDVQPGNSEGTVAKS